MAKNHYVPDFILRNFADTDSALWIMSKQTGHIWCKKPADKRKQAGYDAFAENNYNPDDVEEAFTEVESEAGPIIKEIIRSARKFRMPVLDQVEKEWLCAFLLVQILRVPRIKDFMTNSIPEFPEAEKVFWRVFKSLSAHEMPGGLEPVVSDPDVMEHEHLDYIMWKRMTNMKIDVLRIGNVVDVSFVIGDEPCLLKGWLLKPDERVVMPIARDVYLQLSRPEDFAGQVEMCGPSLVNALNLQIFEKSQRYIAGPNRECLERLRSCTSI